MSKRKGKTSKTKKVAAEAIAKKADRGDDISEHFTNRGKMMAPAIQRVNIDFGVDMLRELDTLAKALNISRQAVIKTFLRQSLDDHYRAQAYRKTGS